MSHTSTCPITYLHQNRNFGQFDSKRHFSVLWANVFPFLWLFLQRDCSLGIWMVWSRGVCIRFNQFLFLAFWGRRLNIGCFLETWDAPLPWRDKRHFCVSLATDACGVHNTSGLPMAHSETRYQSEEIHSWIKTWMIKTCSKLNWDFPFFYYAYKSHLWLKNLAIFLSSRSKTSSTVLVQKSVTWYEFAVRENNFRLTY
jgi:hypothetical protein